MTSMNISVKKEAYRFLKSLKSKDKSFSDVILEFKKRKKGILRFFGIMKDVNWQEREKHMRELRAEFEKKL